MTHNFWNIDIGQVLTALFFAVAWIFSKALDWQNLHKRMELSEKWQKDQENWKQEHEKEAKEREKLIQTASTAIAVMKEVAQTANARLTRLEDQDDHDRDWRERGIDRRRGGTDG